MGSEVSNIEEFADLGSVLGDVGPNDTFSDIVVSEDGMLYVATNRAESIFEISADGLSVVHYTLACFIQVLLH